MRSLKSFWRTYVWKTAEPWVEVTYADGRMNVTGYNDAFIQDQRVKLGGLCDGRTDGDVIKLFVDRDSIAREEPKLEVVHHGIMPDGRIKVELDWNPSFIHHLAENGITGETEDEAIQSYLQRLVTNELLGGDPNEFFTKEQLEAAFNEMTAESDRELDEAHRQLRIKK